MGRPKGSKDLTPRKNATLRAVNEFMVLPPPPEMVPERTEENRADMAIGDWARTLLDNVDTRQALEVQAKSGKLSAAAFRWLRETAESAAPKRESPSKERMRSMAQACNKLEAQMFMNVSRRALGQPEGLIYLGTVGMSNREIFEAAYTAVGQKVPSARYFEPRPSKPGEQE